MRIAVIGSGVSGLAATWALNEHSPHNVHLFEAGNYIGGHTNTVTFKTPTAVHKKLPNAPKDAPAETTVDTGFIVFNEVTYPNFLRFIHHIGAKIIASDMSFSVSRSTIDSKGRLERGTFEWAGSTPAALFSQATNLVNPAHWRMVWDIIRFNHQSLHTLRDAERSPSQQTQTIGAWLDERGYGENFRRNYLIPMTASIWSTPPSTAFSAFPAVTLLRFMHNHHLLQILDRPQWLTLRGGSRSYVDRVVSKLPPEQLHHDDHGAGSGHVVRATRAEKGASYAEWTLTTRDGKTHRFEKVVFACHADAARELLAEELDAKRGDEQADEVRAALEAFRFSKNVAVLHADEQLMPTRKMAWSAWNFLAETKAPSASATSGASSSSAARRDSDRVTLTYWMNLLQSLPIDRLGPVLVTLNPPPKGHPAHPREELQLATYAYDHPIYTSDSVAAQARLESLQGWRGVRFAGAWLKYGFHEDGFSAGLRAAVALGATPPFEPRAAERALPRSEPVSDAALWLGEWVRRNALAPLTATLVAGAVLLAVRALAAALSLVVAATSAVRPSSSSLVQRRVARANKALARVRGDWEVHAVSFGGGGATNAARLW